MDWDKFDMNPRVIAAIKKANITSIKDIFHLSGSDLQRLTKLSRTDVQYLLRIISSALRKNSVLTALQLFQNKAHNTSRGQKLSLGCPVLDGLLRGGIPLMGITEIAGESSAGKTQLGLQLCLSVQYPYKYGGLESGAVYICTEDVFPNKRLQQLIEQLPKLRSDVPSEVMQKIKFGNGIFVEHAADLVTDAVDEREDAVWDAQSCPARTVIPALGITWSNQLLMRLMVCRTVHQAQIAGETSYSRSELRMLRVIFAPHLPQHFCYYTVNLEGVKGIRKIGHDYEEM
ncbi:DNA repair protein XRCC3 isoform 3-T4 [Liasis olivaceus]